MKNAHPFMQGNALWRPVFSSLPHDVLFLRKGTVYWPIEHSDKAVSYTHLTLPTNSRV